MKTDEIKEQINEWFNSKGNLFKYWLIRATTKKFYIKFKSVYKPQLGDIYVKNGVSCEYIGKGRWLPLAKDYSVKLKLGARIKAHYYNNKQNTLLIRNGEVIAHF